MKRKLSCLVLVLAFLLTACGRSKPANALDENAIFSNNLMLVKLPQTFEYAFINEQGEIAEAKEDYQMKFLSAIPFGCNGKTIVSNGFESIFIINTDGEFLADIDLSAWDAFSAHFMPFNEDGYSLFAIYDLGGNGQILWGIVNDQGEIIVEPDYASLTMFDKNGKALASKATGTDRIDLFIVDKSGNETPLGIQAAPSTNLYSLFGSVQHDGLYAAIDLSILGQFDNPDTSDMRYGYLNSDGEWAILPDYSLVRNFSHGRALVRNSYDEVFFIDTDGNIISEVYDTASNFSNDELALVGRNDEFGNRLYGFINIDGEEVIPLQYVDANSFSNGYALVQRDEDDGYFYIDTTGKNITEPLYSSSSGDFDACGFAPVLSYGFDKDDEEVSWSYINQDGDVVLQDVAYVEYFDNIIPSAFDPEANLAVAAAQPGGEFRLIDQQGNVVGRTKFIEYFPANSPSLDIDFII